MAVRHGSHFRTSDDKRGHGVPGDCGPPWCGSYRDRFVGVASKERPSPGSSMSALKFAWRSLVRQPARAALGILGIAAVGALLFDMLLLSEGLVTSMRDLLDQTGFDVRVTATSDLPGSGPRIVGVGSAVDAIATLPSVRSSISVRLANARVERDGKGPFFTNFQGVAGGAVGHGRSSEAEIWEEPTKL